MLSKNIRRFILTTYERRSRLILIYVVLVSAFFLLGVSTPLLASYDGEYQYIAGLFLYVQTAFSVLVLLPMLLFTGFRFILPSPNEPMSLILELCSIFIYS